MNQIAFILGDTFLYWDSIFLALAGATAVCLFLAFWLEAGGRWLPGILAAAGSVGASLLLSRLFHWYYLQADYPSFQIAMTNFALGGYALVGVFAGCGLTAALLRLTGIYQPLPVMLDCMSLALGAGIAVYSLALGKHGAYFLTAFLIPVVLWFLRSKNPRHRMGDITLLFLALQGIGQLIAGIG